MKKTFVNFSNLHTNRWSDTMQDAAMDIANNGEIVNVPFPVVDSHMTKEEIYEKAEECVERILKHNPAAVFAQGEFSLCFRIVNLLKERNIPVYTVCHERIISDEDGKSISGFRFVQFREF